MDELQIPTLTIRTSAPDSTSVSSSPYVSPPSSAFVSALPSPYTSPRATTILAIHNPEETSSSVPPNEHQPANTKLKIVTCAPVVNVETAPRISFSFPIPRISFAKGSISSPASNGKLRSCDVYIGFHGQNPNLVRFCKWLKSELEVQGIACFVADRAKYADHQSHDIADRVICSVTYGIVVVSNYSFFNHLTLEEIRFFSQKKNLIPLFFDTDVNQISSLFKSDSVTKECKEALDELMRCHELKLEASGGNWRSCISKAAGILKSKLGRKSVAEKEVADTHEFPFPRNNHFVGRETELMDIEMAFFGCGEQECDDSDGETGAGSKYISLEVGGLHLEASVEPPISTKSIKKSKCKSLRSSGSSILSLTGLTGVGKTALALEFAYRYCQRYKKVLWIGGEVPYFRQNIMNISVNMGLDLSTDEEKDRARIHSFNEQESEVFKRVKRELFRDMPYLLVIDNLETEREWWEGKDLHDLIPRNTGGTHVIITTRLSKVMSFNSMQLMTLPLADAMTLIRGRRKKEYTPAELEVFGKFDEKLGRSVFGLCVIGSLLSELGISPSTLFAAVNQVQYVENACPSSLSNSDQQFCRRSPFLMKVLSFCVAVLAQTKGKGNLLASRMLQVGAWFASAPISVNLLAAAANNVESADGNKLKKWSRCLKMSLSCFCTGCLVRKRCKNEEESALVLIRLGLAWKVNRRPGCWIQFHPITQMFSKWKYGTGPAKATVDGVTRIVNPFANWDHLWASAFLVFGFKSEPPVVQLKGMDMVNFIKRTALPLATQAFTDMSRCKSGLELLKVCTNVLEEVEKSMVPQIQDWCHGSLCWKKQSNPNVDEYVWQEVTLLKATVLEMRARFLLKGGDFDNGEEVCRTCISIRTVMLGHSHAQTLAAQETLAKLVRMRSKI